MLALALILIALPIALELALRWANDVPLFRKGNLDAAGLEHPFVSNGAVQYDSVLGWSPRPNIRRLHYTLDDHGTRLPTVDNRPLPTGAILAVGDSFTAGSEVHDWQSWPAILEQLVGAPVINAGVGGYGTDQIILRAEQMMDIAKPATVVISFLWHDMGRSEFKSFAQAHKPYYTVEDDRLVLHNKPVPLFSHHFSRKKITKAVLSLSYLAFSAAQWLGIVKPPSPEDSERATPTGTGFDISCKLLARIKQTADDRSVNLVFLVQYGNLEFKAPQPEPAVALINHARTLGITSIDPWPTLQRIHDEDHSRFRSLWMLQPDGVTLGHMSESGNRVIAELVGEALRG